MCMEQLKEIYLQLYYWNKGWIESMLIIITKASGITNKERKNPTINHNNNIKKKKK